MKSVGDHCELGCGEIASEESVKDEMGWSGKECKVN